MSRDQIFAEVKSAEDFQFDRKTAGVFDDMVSRSVPLYHEIQRMVAELAAEFAIPRTAIYDLGCATATTLAALDPVVDPSVRFVGVDNSDDMLDVARRKLAEIGMTREHELLLADVEQPGLVSNASVAILNLTLMFVRPLNRQQVLADIVRGVCAGGCVLLVEKLVVDDPALNRLFIKNYYDLKRRSGYSELEIAQKREALENVLIPYRVDENLAMLQAAGARRAEVFFRWYNFCGIVAVK